MLEALLDAQRDADREAEGRLIRDWIRARGPTIPFPVNNPMWFWTKVAFGTGDCWYWTASLSRGYGVHTLNLGETSAHRLAYRLFIGPIAEGMHVLHRCDVRNCVNPEHLFLGTPRDNMHDMMQKGRYRGHDTSGEHNGNAKLTWAEVDLIRALSGSITQRAMAQRFGVSEIAIGRIIRGLSWR